MIFKRCTSVFFLSLVLVCVIVGCAPRHALQTPAQAAAEFVGDWELVAVAPPGATKEARRLVFRGDGTYAALDAAGGELWAGTYDLDPAAEPKVWDHRSHEAAKVSGDALGIYRLQGDRLTVCCVVGTWRDGRWIGRPRPTRFTLDEADAVLELRRVPPLSP